MSPGMGPKGDPSNGNNYTLQSSICQHHFISLYNHLLIAERYIIIRTTMHEEHHDRKLRRAKRRNFVAKNNKHKAKRHASLKDYRRRPKHPGLED
jgi:hypothetical protein